MKNKEKKSEKNRLQRREQIILTASRLFRRKGYHATTLDDIGRAVKKNKAGLYYYFQNKNEILYEIAFSSMKQLLEMAQAVENSEVSPKEKLEKLVIGHLNWGFLHLGPVTVGQTEMKSMSRKFLNRYITMRDKYEAIFRRVIKKGITEREFRNLDPKLASIFLLTLLNGTHIWFRPSGKLSVGEIASAVKLPRDDALSLTLKARISSSSSPFAKSTSPNQNKTPVKK